MAKLSVLVIALVACTQPAVPDVDDDDDVAALFSPIGQHVLGVLRAEHAKARHKTWDDSADNTFDAGWVLQTPVARYWGRPVSELPVTTACTDDPACDRDFGLRTCATQSDCTYGGTCTEVQSTIARPGDSARRLCVGHSDSFYERIYTLMIGARTSVEIASLGPPDGRFEAALRNAITYLSLAGRAVRVRFVYAAIPGAELVGVLASPADVLTNLVRDLEPGSSVRVAVGELRASLESWPHTKLVAIDGQTAIVGGHNMWTRHYLQSAPTHDLSMQISGSAAQHASRFADELWHATCHQPADLFSTTSISGFPDATIACSDTGTVGLAATVGQAKVISVGRLGTLGDEAADDALVALIDAATTRLRISEQDLGPIAPDAPWPESYLHAFVAAIARGVDIEFVMTNLNALPDGLTVGSAAYSNGWTASDVVHAITQYAAQHPEVAQGADLCSHLHVALLRMGADETWPSGATFGNHVKLVLADDQTFYIGSQNLYPSNLTEYGFIVDDDSAVRTLVDEYWAPAWNASSRTVTSCSQ